MKNIKIISVVLLILLILVTLVSLPWVLMFFFSIFEPNPPVPAITYGEFPFKLEYRIGDETFIVEDVIICEYDGIRWNEGNGKYRAWKESFKCSGEEHLLILTDKDIKVFCNVGKAEYYMGDLKYSVSEEHVPVFYYISNQGSGSARAMIDKYDIELINWQLSKPIKNVFK